MNVCLLMETHGMNGMIASMYVMMTLPSGLKRRECQVGLFWNLGVVRDVLLSP